MMTSSRPCRHFGDVTSFAGQGSTWRLQYILRSEPSDPPFLLKEWALYFLCDLNEFSLLDPTDRTEPKLYSLFLGSSKGKEIIVVNHRTMYHFINFFSFLNHIY